jgi:dihydrofolate synthase/folylpolyglutamate synthase
MDAFAQILSQLESRRDEPNRQESFERFCQALASRQYKFNSRRIIAVAGTNGKGSTAKALQTFLSAEGLKVGLYTSPHLTHTTERIRLGGEPISKEVFIQLFTQLRPVIESFGLSHFEALTLMACEFFFVSQNVDWALFEVGVGGKLDPVKAIPHATSVITRLGLDHQKLLGPTLDDIAKHKFGIVDPGNRVFHLPFAPQLFQYTLPRNGQAEARWQLCESFPFRVESGAADPRFILETPWGDAELDLPGARGAENVSLALQVFAGLGFDPSGVLKHCAKISWPGRMEKIRSRDGSTEIYLSGDHNVQGVESLKELLTYYTYDHLHLIVGIASGKDSFPMLQVLQSIPRAKIYLTQTSYRPQDLSQFEALNAPIGLRPCEMISVDPQACLNQALAMSQAAFKIGKRDKIIVTGSLYLVGTLRALLLSGSDEF